MKCKTSCLVGGAALFVGIWAAAARGTEPFKPENLIGVWTCESAVIDGRPLDEAAARQLRLTLSADRYKSERGEQVLFDSTYTVAAKKLPAEIDMVGAEGEQKGKSAPGIVKLEVKPDGDRLVLCYVMPGRPRPAVFDSRPGSGIFLVTYKRASAK